MPPPKIIEGRNYGSVPHLSDSKLGEHDKYIHFGQEQIIRDGGRDKHDTIIVSLKLDGTNVGVLKRAGKLFTLQRKGYSCVSSPYQQHHEFDRWVTENGELFKSLLGDGDRIVGEWLWQASGIRYEVQSPPFFPFDYFPAADEHKIRLPWQELCRRLSAAGTPFSVPAYAIFDRRTPPDLFPESLLPFSRAVPQSHSRHEGIVVRVERKGAFDLMAKWVRPDFVPGALLPGVRDSTTNDIVINRFK